MYNKLKLGSDAFFDGFFAEKRVPNNPLRPNCMSILVHIPYALRDMVIEMMKFLLHMCLVKKVKIMKILPHLPYVLICS